MSSVSAPRRRVPISEIRGVSRYDRVAGLLVSLVILLGLSVGILLFIWLAGVWSDGTGHVVPVAFHPGQGGDSESVDTGGMKLEAPTLEEIQRTTDLPLMGFRDALTQVEQIARTHSADLASLEQSLPLPTAGGGAAQGFGDSPSADNGPGGGGVARGERWEIGFTPGITLDDYRKQLDFFGIELAAVAPGGGIEYVRGFTGGKPQVERTRSVPETRMYMSWREGSARREADRVLLEAAGVSTAGKQLVQFLLPDMERTLAQLEHTFAGRDARTIRRTRFGIRSKDTGFELYVSEQIPL
jgi:hypothetical protein